MFVEFSPIQRLRIIPFKQRQHVDTVIDFVPFLVSINSCVRVWLMSKWSPILFRFILSSSGLLLFNALTPIFFYKNLGLLFLLLVLEN